MDLTPELAVELQEHRAEPVGEDCWIAGDGWHFVNQVNESARPAASLRRIPASSDPATSGWAQSQRAQSTRRRGPRAPDPRRAAVPDHRGSGPDRLDLGSVQAARAGPDDAGAPGRARRADRAGHRQGTGPRTGGVPAD